MENNKPVNFPQKLTDEDKKEFDKAHGLYKLGDFELVLKQDENGNVLLSDVDDPIIQEMLSYMPKEMRNMLKTSPEKLVEIRKSVSSLREGYLAALPKICNGRECIYKRTCPFLKLSMDSHDGSFLPIGSMCPLELMFINKAIPEYIEDLNLNWDNRIDRIYIMELIEYDIMDLRTSADIANNRYIMENVVGVTEDKEPIIKLEKAIAVDVKMGFKRNRERILDALMATRKSQIERVNIYDAAQYSADIVSHYQNKLKQKLLAKEKHQQDYQRIIDQGETFNSDDEE